MLSLTLKSTLSINSLLYLISIIILQTHGQMDEGSKCSVQGAKGTCKIISDCTPVYNLLLSGVEPKEICGYSGFFPIVCCPNEKNDQSIVPVNRITTTEPSVDTRGALAREKCAEYAKDVFQLQWPPLLLPGQKPINASTCGIKGKTLIVGGTEAVAKEFPHMVALGYNTDNGIKYNCGGSLISRRFVLTAAHCLEGVGPVVARVGDLNLVSTKDISNPKDYKIVETFKNPEYKSPSEYHDIALIKLETDVEINPFVRPACLQTTLPDSPYGKAIATGWGKTNWEGDTESNNLLKVTLNIIDQPSCTESYTNLFQLDRGIIGNWQICAGQPSKDTCHGDSGGPLAIFNEDHLCMYNIIGVTSFGQLCGAGIPAVYTKVYNYIPWLESIIWAEHD